MKKLIIAIMVIIALAMVFAGCANDRNNQTSPGVSPIVSPDIGRSPSPLISPLPDGSPLVSPNGSPMVSPDGSPLVSPDLLPGDNASPAITVSPAVSPS
jgi:hypothetical protein